MDNYQINDNLLIQRGRHSLKTGVEFRRLDIFREAQRFRREANSTFNKVYTVRAAQRRRQPDARPATAWPTCCWDGPAKLRSGISSARMPSRPTGAFTFRTTGRSIRD